MTRRIALLSAGAFIAALLAAALAYPQPAGYRTAGKAKPKGPGKQPVGLVKAKGPGQVRVATVKTKGPASPAVPHTPPGNLCRLVSLPPPPYTTLGIGSGFQKRRS
jgi:hypothetical protein